MAERTVLKVRSHVGRDLLQSAQLFRHEHAVVWEYVANGLEYKDPSTKPVVSVRIDPKARSITISDNGRGMLLSDLEAYFQMHGENRDRKQGRPGRGFFGTGKSAAFGIAKSLTITTVRQKKRSKVQLTRSDVEAHPDGSEIPIHILEQEVGTQAANGTVVEINEVFLKNIDIHGVIRHIERHIAHWPNASVIVNNHDCEFAEPDVGRQMAFPTKGTEFERLLGDTKLTIKVAKAPLDEEFRGVAILSAGVWHETTMAGCDRKPFAEYLFGTLDVQTLSTDQSGISPFDMSRSMKLNPRNELVADIFRFVGVNLESVRRDLEREDRERRQSEEQRRLQEQGKKIAEFINKHFREWSAKLKNTMAKAGVGRDIIPADRRGDTNETAVVFGDELPAIVVGQTFENGTDIRESSAGTKPTVPVVEPDEEASQNLSKKDRHGRNERQPEASEWPSRRWVPTKKEPNTIERHEPYTSTWSIPESP